MRLSPPWHSLAALPQAPTGVLPPPTLGRQVLPCSHTCEDITTERSQGQWAFRPLSLMEARPQVGLWGPWKTRGAWRGRRAPLEAGG